MYKIQNNNNNNNNSNIDNNNNNNNSNNNNINSNNNINNSNIDNNYERIIRVNNKMKIIMGITCSIFAFPDWPSSARNNPRTFFILLPKPPQIGRAHV